MDNQLGNGKLNIFNKSAFTVVGNPTITDDGIASGFSRNNYVNWTTGYTNTDYSTLEINFPSFIISDITGEQYIMTSVTGWYFTFGISYGGWIQISAHNSSGGQLTFTNTGNYKLISANTSYYAKLVFNGSRYDLLIKGGIWTDWTSLKYAETTEKILLGANVRFTGRYDYPNTYFKGSIDLKQFSITVDGEEVFSGTKTINTNLKQYLPIVYEGIVESETQQDSLSIEIDKMNNTYEQALMDQFVQFASLKVLPYYENIFNIVANPETESVQFRRERILSRMKMLTPPYTYYYLRTMLDGFFGKDRYKLYIDNNNFTIALESSASDSLWYHEIQVSITAVKPCNMIFINMPRLSTNLTVNEQISHSRIIYNYKLDGTWLLGLKPFITQEEDIVDKMANVHSIQQTFIDKTIEEWKTFFAKSVINDSYNVTQLNISKEDSNLIITYEVTSTMANSITNIKLIGADDTILINSHVFIPIDDYVTIKHIINLQEVLNG